MSKKVLMVIAPSDFRDEEYLQPKELFENAGFDVVTASKKTGEITGMLGAKAFAEKNIDEINIDDFDVVVFVGGTGAATYFDDERALEIAKGAYSKGKIIAAICIAPTILANAGILEGKKATIWEDPRLVDNLKEKGAIYTGENVTRDGKVITGKGPFAARDFGEEIVRALKE
jgi:protease I